jgi:TonB family protein
VAIKTVLPRLPPAAFSRGKGGWVLARYELDGSGSAKNVQVLEGEPRGQFDEFALLAIRGTEFKVGVSRTECRQVFAFTMNP